MAQVTRLSTADEAALRAAYGWTQLTLTALPDRGTINSNYAALADGVRFFVRVNEGKTAEQVDAEARLVGFLHANLLPTPLPVRTIEHQRFAMIQDKPVTVFEWVDGRDADERHPTAAAQVGALLGAMQRAAVGYPLAQLPPNLYDLPRLVARVERIAAAGGYDEVVRIGTDELTEAAGRDRGEPALIHQDLFPDNVIVDADGRFVAVLDFEQSTTGPRAYDLAVTINAWCWRGDQFDVDAADALVSAYDQATPAPRVAGTLLPELRLAAARFAITRVTDIELAADVHPDLRARKDYRDYVRRWQAWQDGPAHAWALAR